MHTPRTWRMARGDQGPRVRQPFSAMEAQSPFSSRNKHPSYKLGFLSCYQHLQHTIAIREIDRRNMRQTGLRVHVRHPTTRAFHVLSSWYLFVCCAVAPSPAWNLTQHPQFQISRLVLYIDLSARRTGFQPGISCLFAMNSVAPTPQTHLVVLPLQAWGKQRPSYSMTLSHSIHHTAGHARPLTALVARIAQTGPLTITFFTPKHLYQRVKTELSRHFDDPRSFQRARIRYGRDWSRKITKSDLSS